MILVYTKTKSRKDMNAFVHKVENSEMQSHFLCIYYDLNVQHAFLDEFYENVKVPFFYINKKMKYMLYALQTLSDIYKHSVSVQVHSCRITVRAIVLFSHIFACLLSSKVFGSQLSMTQSKQTFLAAIHHLLQLSD